MSHNLMCPLSTRNTIQRGGLSVFNQISTIMMSGILVALVFPMVIMPILGVDKNLWILVMSVLSILALPLTLLEYYFTKERVTEENPKEEKKVPFLTQLKIVLGDKYMLIMYLYFFIYTFASSLKNLGLVYYCNYVLGTYNDGITQTMISVIGGIPMGIGIFLVWPLAKRFGKRNVTMFGFLLYALGSGICWAFPTNMVIVLIGQFIKNVGGLPSAYVFMALFADGLDHIEWKSGVRCDGVAMSVYNIIAVAIIGVATSVFNAMLSSSGYVVPKEVDGAIVATQTQAVKDMITFAFVGLETITGVLLAALLLFLNVEKNIDRKQEKIKEYQKEKALALGEEWIAPEVKAAQEEERYLLENEEAFLAALKIKCEKKGLDFEKEKEAHIESVKKKKEKEAQKKEALLAKEKAKKEKIAAKRQEKESKWSPEKLEAYKAKLQRKREKDEEVWQKELLKGEAYRKKIEASLRE